MTRVPDPSVVYVRSSEEVAKTTRTNSGLAPFLVHVRVPPSLENKDTLNKVYELGGSEFFTFQQIIETIMDVTHRRRFLVPLSPITLRAMTVFLEGIIPNFPISSFWLDYFAVNRTCAVDSMPRIFGLMPARFTYRLDYLIRKPWYQRLWDSATRGIAALRSR